MTENEVKDWLNLVSMGFYESDERCRAIRAAIQALSDIQAYRAIGTIEEFKDLKEKSTAKKLYGNEWNPVVIGDTVSGHCPVCMTEFVCITPKFYKANNCGYCKACGQKLDWIE